VDHNAVPEEKGSAPLEADAWVCYYQGYPTVPVPGANIFLSATDASTEEDSEGNRVVSCHPISTTGEARLVYKGLRILWALAR
jgi:hypothetical protein